MTSSATRWKRLYPVEVKMLNRNVSFLLGVLLMAAPAIAQTQLLLDPSQAPITLKGGWERKSVTSAYKANRGDIAVKISKINSDGTFEGKLDFLTTGRFCHAIDEPIKEGRITANGLTVVANGGPPAVCGMMTLEFKRGTEKYLQGRLTSEAAGRGVPMWLDAPK